MSEPKRNCAKLFSLPPGRSAGCFGSPGNGDDQFASEAGAQARRSRLCRARGPRNFRCSQTAKFTVSGAESPAERRIFVPRRRRSRLRLPGGAPKPPVLPVAPKPPSVIGGPRPPVASPPLSVPPLRQRRPRFQLCLPRGSRPSRAEGDREGSSERGDYAAEFASSLSPSAKKARLFDVKFRDNGCAAGSKRRRRRIDGRNSRLGGFSSRGWRAGLDVPLAFGWKHPEGGHARISRGYGFSFD